VAAPAVVGRHGDRCVGRRHGAPGVGGDERLVAEPDDHGVGTERVGASMPVRSDVIWPSAQRSLITCTTDG